MLGLFNYFYLGVKEAVKRGIADAVKEVNETPVDVEGTPLLLAFKHAEEEETPADEPAKNGRRAAKA
jgi:hypothetical protein